MADINLTHEPKTHGTNSAILPQERKGRSISEGRAYAIWGKSRWKMEHDAVVQVYEKRIDGLSSEYARVGLTLRFFRKSFGKVLAASEPVPLPTLLAGQGVLLLDAYYYDLEGARKDQRNYPHSARAPT